MTESMKAIVKPVKKKSQELEVRESIVPKIKELYPHIHIADNNFKYEDILGTAKKEYYFEDPVDYEEIKKLINSVKHGYPTVIVRLSDTSLDEKLIDFLGVCRYVFPSKEYTLVLAQKGYATPVYHIKEKFKVVNLLNVKGS
jgi:hypothetical protein